jgi:hypothetical protein
MRGRSSRDRGHRRGRGRRGRGDRHFRLRRRRGGNRRGCRGRGGRRRGHGRWRGRGLGLRRGGRRGRRSRGRRRSRSATATARGASTRRAPRLRRAGGSSRIAPYLAIGRDIFREGVRLLGAGTAAGSPRRAGGTGAPIDRHHLGLSNRVAPGGIAGQRCRRQERKADLGEDRHEGESGGRGQAHEGKDGAAHPFRQASAGKAQSAKLAVEAGSHHLVNRPGRTQQ